MAQCGLTLRRISSSVMLAEMRDKVVLSAGSSKIALATCVYQCKTLERTLVMLVTAS